METPKPRPPYYAWLLRCWREGASRTGQPGRWRFSLEAPGTGIRRGFASLPALVFWLEEQLAEEDMSDDTP
jgi:hypothetical protein